MKSPKVVGMGSFFTAKCNLKLIKANPVVHRNLRHKDPFAKKKFNGLV
jgi:hypothetical protein